MAAKDTDELMTELMNAVRAERELSSDLAQYVGEWVAVRDHEVVAHAATLAELLNQVDTDAVEGVFQVAEQGTASFF
jgi:Family of unknown function (DUF5678)